MYIFVRPFSAFLIAIFCLFSVPAAAREHDALVRVVPGLPEKIDPQNHEAVAENLIYSDLFTGLTTHAADGSIITGVAHSWTVSEDGKTYIFNIRGDAVWSDGQPVTALDFVLAFKRLFAIGAKSMQSNAYSPIEDSAAQSKIDLPITSDLLQSPFSGVVALDTKTLQFRLTKPLPYFLSLLANPPAFPVPHHLYVTRGENWTEPAYSLGNGPYKLEGVQSGTLIKMRKNPLFYAADNVAIEAVHYIQVPSNLTIARVMLSGKADISFPLPHFQIEAGGDVEGYYLHKQSRPSLYSLDLNPNSDKLKSVTVRKALYLATNRAQLLEAMDSSYVSVAGLVPSMEGYVSSIRIPEYESALKEAKRLMQSEGYSDQKLLHLSFKTMTGQAPHRTGIFIKRLWRKIYVDLDIVQSDFDSISEDILAGDFEVVRRSWVADFVDPYNFLQLYTHAYNPEFFKQKDPTLLDLFALADSDAENRYAHLQRAERFLLGKYLTIPLFSIIGHFLVADRVQGWSESPISDNHSRWLSFHDEDSIKACC